MELSILTIKFTNIIARIIKIEWPTLSAFMLAVLVLALIMMRAAEASILVTADFKYQPNIKKIFVPNNFVGISLNWDEIADMINTTSFQGYILNSNLKGSFLNNFKPTIRMPKNWYYDCSTLGLDPTNLTQCATDLSANQSLLDQLGQYIWNTASQPFWAFGLNNRDINFEDFSQMFSVYYLFSRVYQVSHLMSFEVEMMAEADRAVDLGMRTGNYTPQDFMAEARRYNQLGFVKFRAPGLSEWAGHEWLDIIPQYYNTVMNAIFTFEPTVFPNRSLLAFQSLLSESSTSGYLYRLLHPTPTTTLSFLDKPAALSKVHLTTGEGIDGVTNTFAAAVWWIDFIMEAALAGFGDVGIQGLGGFQSIFQRSGAGVVPTALYYGSLMAILAIESKPRMIVPGLKAGTSSRIKVWGFESPQLYKILLLNKDPNPSLSGLAILQVKSDIATTLQCIYLQAPELASKANQMTIAGHHYIGGNSTPQGSYKSRVYRYQANREGFSVELAYAQVALCEMPNFYTTIPTKKQCFQSRLALLLLIALWLVIP